MPETLKSKAAKPHNIFDFGLGNLVKAPFIPKVGILLIINFLIGTTFTIFTYAFQPYFLNVLGQNSQKLTLMFIMFGTLSLLMQTQGIKFLTRNYTLTNIVLFAIFIRSTSFILMPIWTN